MRKKNFNRLISNKEIEMVIEVFFFKRFEEVLYVSFIKFFKNSFFLFFINENKCKNNKLLVK